jgi:hypothetical protein
MRQTNTIEVTGSPARCFNFELTFPSTNHIVSNRFAPLILAFRLRRVQDDYWQPTVASRNCRAHPRWTGSLCAVLPLEAAWFDRWNAPVAIAATLATMNLVVFLLSAAILGFQCTLLSVALF